MTRARVIVTGAGGFVGANLTRRLVADGHDVVAVERPGGAGWRLDDVRVVRKAVDLRNSVDVRRLVSETRPEWVFHLASHGAYSWQANAEEIFETNLLGAVNLIECCLATECPVFVSAGSSSEYGCKDHAPDEDEAIEPNSDYAVAKASATLYASYAGRTSGRRIVTLRLYSVYGPWEDPRRLVPTLIEHGLRGALPPLVDPDVAHDFVYIDDVVEAFARIPGAESVRPGAVYNIGTGVQTTLREIVDIARAELAVNVVPEWGTMPNRRWDTAVWVANASRAAADFGWVPRVDVRTGFRRTIEWQRTRRARSSLP
jgi:nucleoside-diphosphate-sugar epimerase